MNSALKKFVINHWLKPVAWIVDDATQDKTMLRTLVRSRRKSWEGKVSAELIGRDIKAGQRTWDKEIGRRGFYEPSFWRIVKSANRQVGKGFGSPLGSPYKGLSADREMVKLASLSSLYQTNASFCSLTLPT